MSKKVLEILNDFKEWNNEWRRYDKGMSKQFPIPANEFAKLVAKKYNIKEDE